jgi:hypothetical protein
VTRAPSPPRRQGLDAAAARIGSEWVAAMQAMQSLDPAIGRRLAACEDGAMAASICAEWLGHRLDSLIVAQHRMLEAWLDDRADRGATP